MKIVIFILALLTNLSIEEAQDEIENVQLALNSGSAKELVRYFNKTSEVKIAGTGGSMTISQAESVLRDFFQQNPPGSFLYIHKGQSPKGLKYNIGQYTSESGIFRIVILMKELDGSYVVDTITIDEE